ncbi:VCBS repeat-containing protein [Candidatus Sumerlaeota bacterium]|nr:VCBS repeat-containing protein [Candidatus Sumerlaeota bacterium]
MLPLLTGSVALAQQPPDEIPIPPPGIYYTQEILGNIPELNPSLEERFVSTSGFTITRTYVQAIATSPEEPVEEPDPLPSSNPRRNQEEEVVDVVFYTVGPELWFLGHPANDQFDMQVVGINLVSSEIACGPYSLPGDAADPLSRLAMIQSMTTAEPVSGALPELGKDDRYLIVTNPRSHRVTGFLLDPDLPAGTQLISSFQFDAADYDDDAIPGDPLNARALADVCAQLLEEQPEPWEIDPQTEAIYYFQVFDHRPTQIQGIDREHQPYPDLLNGRADPEMPALLSTLSVGPPVARATSVNLAQLAPTTAIYATPEGQAFPFPSGVAIDTNVLGGDNGQTYFIARTGGFRDALFLRTTDEMENPIGEEIYNSANFHPYFPLRLSEVEFDEIIGSMWVRTEVVLNPEGEQIFPDLYHITPVSPELALPNLYSNPTDPLNFAGRGDMNRDGRLDSADIVWLVNYLNLGADPNFDPGLINRVDVDANGRYDFFDFEGIVTQILVGGRADPPLLNIPAIALTPDGDVHTLPAQTVWDVEVDDLNHDGYPETFALYDDAVGTSLYFVPGEIGEFPPDPNSAQIFPLDFPARDMTLEDFTADGLPDLALVTSNVGGTAYLHLGFTQSINPSLEIALAFTPGFEVGPSPLDITTGNFDTDSRPDILIGLDRDEDNLAVFSNRPGQGLERMLLTYGDAPRGLATGDLAEGGGQGDLVIAAEDDFTVELISINRAGARQVISTRDTANAPRDVVIGRLATPEGTYSPLSGDPYLPGDFFDVAVIESPAVSGPALQIFRGNGQGQLSLAADIQIISVQTAVDGEVADFNRDGRDDVVIVGRKAIAIYGGNPLLQPVSSIRFDGLAPVLSFGTGDITDAEVGDFNGDGFPDMVVAISGTFFSSRLVWVENMLEPQWPPVE